MQISCSSTWPSGRKGRPDGQRRNCRDLRARAATDTDDLAHSQHLLGHKNRSTTEIYTRERRGELVKPQIQKGMLQFAPTKSGKNRAVSVSDDLHDELKKKAEAADTDRLFKYSYSAFRDAIERAEIKLPERRLKQQA